MHKLSLSLQHVRVLEMEIIKIDLHKDDYENSVVCCTDTNLLLINANNKQVSKSSRENVLIINTFKIIFIHSYIL